MDNYPVSKNALTFDIMNDINKFRGRELSLSVWPGRGYTKNRHSRVQKEFINPLPLVGDQFGGSFCTQTASIRETAEPHCGGKNCY